MMATPAHERAVRTFYSHDDASQACLGVCRGLSCELNGAAALAARLAADHTVIPVYCLGRCDQSPAIITPDQKVLSSGDALQWPRIPAAVSTPATPHIRTASRRAVVTERIGQGSHAALDHAWRAGVYAALTQALRGTPEDVLATIEASGEQGRGGAGYPTGRKWRTCAATKAGRRYVIANGDEGDPGSFIDRVLLEDDPHAVLEGLILCGFTVGASEGIIFIRAEYPLAKSRVNQAIVEAREAGILGASVMGSDFAFDLRVVSGQGSYVCGEETALLNAIEGRRGEVRIRPPYPASAGLFGRPTVVNNIETLINVPWILREGADAYRRLGTASSPGTKAFCLNRGFARPGIVEAEFGVRLAELVYDYGGGCSEGDSLRALALGGPMGSVLEPSALNICVDYPLLQQQGIRLGHGGMVAIPASADIGTVLLNWVEFMANESCGKCVPCALGSGRALTLVRKLPGQSGHDLRFMEELMPILCLMESASLCGFGQSIAAPIRDLARMACSRPSQDQPGQ